ncbi:hypothetical protein D3C80_1670200 [compost metagenome]
MWLALYAPLPPFAVASHCSASSFNPLMLVVLPAILVVLAAISVVLPAILVVLVSTCVPSVSIDWLVANSCEPFTTSVLLAFRRPAATLVRVRSLPTSPTLRVLVGVVPAKA